jgi:hypothetical protein
MESLVIFKQTAVFVIRRLTNQIEACDANILGPSDNNNMNSPRVPLTMKNTSMHEVISDNL